MIVTKKRISVTLTDDDLKRLELLSHGHSKSTTISEALRYLQYQRVKDFERAMDRDLSMKASAGSDF